MKKFFTLVAMALMAVGANAQTLVAEIDWTTQDAYTGWCSGENGSSAAIGAEGLEISVPAEGSVYWEPQTIILQPFDLEEDASYKVVITAKVPTSGELQLNMGSWDDGVSQQQVLNVEASNDFQEIVLDCPDWEANTTNNHVLWQSGKLVGTSIIKKVEVWNMSGDTPPAGDTVISEIDWTTQDAYTGWCSGENGSSAAIGAEGLEITVPAEGSVYWEPQTIILQPFDLEEDASYKVVITAKVPTSGELQLNMGSWDDGVSQQQVLNVEGSDDFQEIVLECPDWEANTTNNHVLWQSGKLVGTSIIKKVQVIQIGGATGIKAVKNESILNNTRFNLAGQKVNDNYKGVIIQNGKKFIQK